MTLGSLWQPLVRPQSAQGDGPVCVCWCEMDPCVCAGARWTRVCMLVLVRHSSAHGGAPVDPDADERHTSTRVCVLVLV
jgi:hypothetical protein